ncbi:MAG: 1-acyl-sn-glycerol-3-phosphate acyltransferase [Mogibacterium sp.]|nr:1-acyl-sn-glycerol-3-phosphate acyltransferase [Mogibacterium sp.]
MAKQADKAEREKADRRRKRSWDFSQLIIGPWMSRKFNFTHDGFEPAEIEGPVLVAINHACAYDPILLGVAFRNKPLTFIASEHILRMKTWGPVLDRHFSLIPHQNGAKSSRTALVAMKRIKRGESIFLAAEGEQTWDGRSMPVMPYTGKLVKGSGATLVTYMLEGGYLSAPRWSMETRKGKVYGHMVNVYSPDTLKEMSDEEVEAAIAKDLWFDTWEWQKTRPEGPVRFKCKVGFAEGLERDVFTCPECGAFGTLRSSGDNIGCSCGFKVRMTDTGFFEPAVPVETIVDWEKLDREALTARMKELRENGSAEETLIFADDNVTLVSIGDDHAEEEAAHGKVALIYKEENFVLTIGEHEFKVPGISNMTMVLAARVVFSDESGYYELRSEKSSKTNLRKYVIARDLLKDIVKE